MDRVDDLRVANKQLTTIEPAGVDTDPIRDAETVIEAAQRLTDALANVRGAAERAAEHRSRGDLAADIGTRTTLLFPRPTKKPPPTASTPVRIAAPMTSETTIAAHEST